MHFVSTEGSGSDKLARAQALMQVAVKRLQKEFYQILSMNRAHLDPESVSTRSSRTSTGSSSSLYDEDDETRAADESSVSEAEDASLAAMSDLRLIAECMISSGYAKECLKIYIVIRKSIVDEGIYKLGVEKTSSSQIHKASWEAVEWRVDTWLNAVRAAVKTLFNGERILCDHVFAGHDSLRESCFADVTREGAGVLFAFPEAVAKHARRVPEMIFRLLDMYGAIADRWPEIESIFSDEAAAGVRAQAASALARLAEAVRAVLHDFETAVLKDPSKSPVAGAGIHDLTVDAMAYVANLADYSGALSEILAEAPPAAAKNKLPESYFGFSDSDDSPAPAVSLKMAWLILVLLCKLDTKAKHYKDISLSYLFLANNLQYVVGKVRTSNLKYLLGDDWLARHESKVKQFAARYERLGWGHVIDSLPSDPTAADTPAKAKETFKKFNAAFDQACRKQGVCVVPDNKLRDHIKVSIARKIFRLYREFYNAHKEKMERERFSASVVRYAPEDVGHHLSDLFFGHFESWGASSVESSPMHYRA
ncbi:exocyst subunit EXO70 family protein [Striga asiatica]|uniref:Exocyst subunit Exo70 family protein n=1 Tax=Striga asiatica TaxID=4170 RepID=A0A5A7RJD8_STRAF|nr:exocyst subunit EXO70 family protein [Striga asiatica]